MDRDAELRPVSRPSGLARIRRFGPPTGLRDRGRTPCPQTAAAGRAAGGLRASAGELTACLSAAILSAFLALPARPAAAQAATPVQGGAPCGARSEVVSRLEAKYGETRRGYGLQRGKAVVEVYASAETGSWTIIMSTPNGLACLVAAGENWAVPEIEVTEPVGDPA